MSDPIKPAEPPVLTIRLANGGPVIFELPVDLLLAVESYRDRQIGRAAFEPGRILYAELRGQYAEAKFVFIVPDRTRDE